jgi:hypothetical protein
MPKPSEAMDCRVVGRVGKHLEIARTAAGTEVCRLVVTQRAAGPASSPVQIGLYVKGELAKRCCRGLGEGDLIEAFGQLGRMRSKAKRPELVGTDVKLWEKAGAR